MSLEEDLVKAAESGDIVQIRALLDRGASVDYESSDDFTALIFAIEGQTQFVGLPLGHGAGVDDAFSDAWTALLLDQRACCDHEPFDGWADLMLAAQEGHTETVALLLDRGASVDYESRDGWTALMLAAQEGHTETVALLLGG